MIYLCVENKCGTFFYWKPKRESDNATNLVDRMGMSWEDAAEIASWAHLASLDEEWYNQEQLKKYGIKRIYITEI